MISRTVYNVPGTSRVPDKRVYVKMTLSVRVSKFITDADDGTLSLAYRVFRFL